MAEATPPRNGNGERLGLTLNGKTLGLQVRDLVPVLLIVVGFGFGYLLWLATDRRFSAAEARQGQILQTVQDNRTALDHDLDGMRAFLAEKIREARETQEAQTQTLKKFIVIMEYNRNRPPDQQIPLDIDPPHERAR